MSRAVDSENSILNEFKKSIWEPFLYGVEHYQLINNGDNIAVCISGGKDSMLMAKLVQLLKKYGDIDFGVRFIVMDPGYNDENRQRIIDNAKILEIPIEIFNSDIFEIANNTGKSPCYLCARMRRGHLYAKAKECGCNKIALGHHFSDVIETTLIGMFYGSQLQGMLPKLHSTNFDGMELIRPMYCINEDAIIEWCNANDLHFIQCACRFTEDLENGTGVSKRQDVKNLIKKMRVENPNVEKSIFESIHNLNLNGIVGYKSQGKEYKLFDTQWE